MEDVILHLAEILDFINEMHELADAIPRTEAELELIKEFHKALDKRRAKGDGAPLIRAHVVDNDNFYDPSRDLIPLPDWYDCGYAEHKVGTECRCIHE